MVSVIGELLISFCCDGVPGVRVCSGWGVMGSFGWSCPWSPAEDLSGGGEGGGLEIVDVVAFFYGRFILSCRP